MGGVPVISPHSNNNLVAGHEKSTFVRTLKSMEDLAKHWCCQRPKICFEKAGPCLDDELIDHSPGQTHKHPYLLLLGNSPIWLCYHQQQHLPSNLLEDTSIHILGGRPADLGPNTDPEVAVKLHSIPSFPSAVLDNLPAHRISRKHVGPCTQRHLAQ